MCCWASPAALLQSARRNVRSGRERRDEDASGGCARRDHSPPRAGVGASHRVHHAAGDGAAAVRRGIPGSAAWRGGVCWGSPLRSGHRRSCSRCRACAGAEGIGGETMPTPMCEGCSMDFPECCMAVEFKPCVTYYPHAVTTEMVLRDEVIAWRHPRGPVELGYDVETGEL